MEEAIGDERGSVGNEGVGDRLPSHILSSA